jgi:hypothetical protein
MFDRITALVPLPGYPADAPKDGFWTTDFGCDETVYTIREDGRLLSELWHLEPVPEQEQEFSSDLNCLLRASGQTKKVIDGLVHKEFQGTLHFSRYYDDILYEFEGEFSKGVLQKLKPRRRDDAR